MKGYVDAGMFIEGTFDEGTFDEETLVEGTFLEDRLYIFTVQYYGSFSSGGRLVRQHFACIGRSY